jgi:hypothetical protein
MLADKTLFAENSRHHEIALRAEYAAAHRVPRRSCHIGEEFALPLMLINAEDCPYAEIRITPRARGALSLLFSRLILETR